MNEPKGLQAKYRHAWLVPVALGFLAFVLTSAGSPQRAWANILVGNFYFVSIALYGTVFVALCYVFSAGWAVSFRRIPEAMSAYLPIGALFMLALFFGRSHIYSWSQPEVVASNPLLQHKVAYLNTPFFFVRMAMAFGVWILFSLLLRRHSKQQDIDGSLEHTRKNQTYSVVFLVLCAVTFIFASFDWIMSLEWQWYSTIFPAYCLTGLLLGGSAAMSILFIYVQKRGLIAGASHHLTYEISRIICATSTLWAYIWFSQYMLIYYTNIPSETAYFVRRLVHGWAPLFLLNPVINWLIPLVILIPASARRSPRSLVAASVIVLIGRWVDTYLLIMPAFGGPVRFGLAEFFIFVGFLALFLRAFWSSFRAGESVPKRDPYLVESLHLRV